MRLGALFPQAALDAAAASLDVSGLTADSRAVEPGFAFFAVPGSKADGLAFVPQAVSRGARVIVAEAPIDHDGVVGITSSDVRRDLSLAAARFFPAQPQTIVAITGTSGKTSIAAFTRQIWRHLGLQAASLGTIGVVAPSGAVYGSLTTPDPVTLHKTLDGLARDGVTHLAMEASSHGLSQKRLDGVRLAAGAFSNLSRDHLDYHPTLQDYLAAKLRLFDSLLEPGRSAVIDADSDVATKVIAACAARKLDLVTVGQNGRSLHLRKATADDLSTRLEIEHCGRLYDVLLPLAGAFQVSNALIAAGLCIATGAEPPAVFAALGSLEGAPGRLELVGRRRGAPVFVDYAHKPDALEKVLTTLRPVAAGRLIVVFGCGGDRDAGKRPVMGEIAARLADEVIVTDDNPRSEEPQTIRRAILAGVRGGARLHEIGDRAAAIAEGIARLGQGDVLVIAGKGHETGQIVGDRILPFSDRDCALAALKEHAA